MILKIFTCVMMTFFVLPASAGQGGGSSTVGDGGFAVVCFAGLKYKQVRAELLDLFEEKVLTQERKKVTLGNGANPEPLLEVALRRLQKKTSLTEREFSKVSWAAFSFLRDAQDPWMSGARIGTNDFVRAQDILLDKRVYSQANSRGCRIAPVAIRPAQVGTNRINYERLCRARGLSFEDCFFIDNSIYKDLSASHRACLALHESLRYLPESLRPRSERQLRKIVAEICFE